MARGRAGTCREKLCKNILVTENTKQVVFDYILPIFFCDSMQYTGVSHLRNQYT